MAQVRLQNWKREITYRAHSLEFAQSADDIVRVVKDRGRYPGPVRVKGSHHSTTRCVVNEGGTVIDVTRMNKILGIDRTAKTITMQAGVLHIDAAKALEREGLQFYVNVEIGNMTVGSGACGSTKDASFFSAAEGWEFGQVASYAIGIKAVNAEGRLIEVIEADGALMAAMRSSYGMLGVIYEVTFRVKEIAPKAVEHIRYHIAEDRQSLFSYTRKSAALTLDPVSTGGPGWQDYLVAYNAFCSRHNGTPLFNQTPGVTPSQAQKAFGPEIGQFMEIRQKHDPGGRFLVPFFRNLFEGT